MDSNFVPFGPTHLTALVSTVAVPAVLVSWVKWNRSENLTRWIACALASILLINEAASFIWKWHIGTYGWDNGLPMHLCDWVTFTTAIACLWRKQWAYELSFFWGLSGTLQAIITPNLAYNFQHPEFWIFFISHTGLVATILYLTFAFPLRPTWASIPRAYGWLLFYAAFAGMVNWLVGANYGFLAHKPAGASLLDYFGPWPWYIVITTLLALLFFVAFYLPFAVVDAVSKRSAADRFLARTDSTSR